MGANEATREPRMYSELAEWWPLLSAPADYAEEAGFYRDALAKACAPRTVLELGSGGGNNASHLKRHFELTLADRSKGMLDVSRRLNPECEHVQADMCELRLERLFDAVFLHDAVMYLTSEADLRRAFETAFVHCAPGGALLVVPDFFRETFQQGSDTGGHDGDGRGLRYLEWCFDPDPSDTRATTEFALLLRRDGEPTRFVHDTHEVGLFPRELWLQICRDVGFEPEIQRVVHTDLAPIESELLLCRR